MKHNANRIKLEYKAAQLALQEAKRRVDRHVVQTVYNDPGDRDFDEEYEAAEQAELHARKLYDIEALESRLRIARRRLERLKESRA